MVRRPLVTFQFGSRTLRAPADVPLTAAVVSRPWAPLGRSIRYHRPRAPFCGIGACTQCLVRVNGQPNVRGCQYVPSDGDRIETENAWPSVRWDVARALDLVFPHGVDTLRGFGRPLWARRLYQWVVRRLAGYGRPPARANAPARPAARSIATRVAIVGAGKAGMACARRLAALGVDDVSLIDSDRVVDRFPGTEVFARTRVVFLEPPDTPGGPFVLYADGPDGGIRLDAARVVIATGSYDANLWFADNDRPGVVTLAGALSVTPPDGHPPFHRALVVGDGARAKEAIDRFGASVAAVVAPGAISPEVVRAASDHGIDLYPRSLVVAARGFRRVRAVDLVRRGDGSPFRLAGDAVILAHRRLPNHPLLFQGGAKMRYGGPAGSYFPVLAPGGETSVSGLYAAGSVAGFADSEASGTAVAEAIGGGSAPALPPVPWDGVSGWEGYYRELLARPRSRAKWVACACEDVLLDELEAAHARGYRGIEVVKRYTGLGTGLCQGRYCVPEALLVLAGWEERRPEEVGYLTQRPPVFPTPLATWVGFSSAGSADRKAT